MFGNVVDLGAMLILVNCMDPDEPITIDFHRDIQRIGYQVWPRSTVLGLAAHAGLQLMQITTFTDDESCGQYGPVTAMTLLPTESPSVSQGGRFG